MKPFEEEYEVESKNWEYAIEKVSSKEDLIEATNLKNSQFHQPLLQFSGACAGCGETPYAKLVTQLFGDRMILANATGCSSIWGGASAPSTPYCVNKDGRGPAWANSLFEDNAEYGYGMAVAVKKIREKLINLMTEFIELDLDEDLNMAFNTWLEGKDDPKASKAAAGFIIPKLDRKLDNEIGNEILKEIAKLKDYLIKNLSGYLVGTVGLMI